jgi:hypothetical protein
MQSHLLGKLARQIADSEDFPNDTPVLLCRIIEHTTRLVDEHLDSADADQLGHLAYVLHEMAQHLRYADRSKLTQTPWSMVECVETLLRDTVGGKSHFIIRPQWSYNYGIVGDFLSFYRSLVTKMTWMPVGDWESGLPVPVDHELFSISFPRLERQNCLAHVNWGHELGHILTNRWAGQHFPNLWQSCEADIRAEIETEVSQNPPQHVHPLFKDTILKQLVSQQTQRAMEVLRQGLTELLCDAVGVHLFGPALLAELCEFASVNLMDESPLNIGGYPPWRYRIRKVFDVCRETLDDKVAKAGHGVFPTSKLAPYVDWLREVDSLVASTPDVQTLNAHVITRKTYEVIEKEWTSIRKQVISLIPKPYAEQYSLPGSGPCLEELITKLEAGIPPCESGTWPKCRPSDLRDILNAGWAYKVTLMMSPSTETASKIENTHRLLLKAIEAGHVQRKYGPKLTRGNA